MIIAVIGRTGSGKTTILKEIEKYGYEKIVEFTTRPIRIGEVNDLDYHFKTDEEYVKMIEQDLFAENQEFNTIYGLWRYGAIKSDFEGGKRIIALGPLQLQQLWKNNIEVFSIFIDTPVEQILQRTGTRGDEIAEVERRIKKDDPIYESLRDKVSLVVDGSKTPQEIMEDIRKAVSL